MLKAELPGTLREKQKPVISEVKKDVSKCRVNIQCQLRGVSGESISTKAMIDTGNTLKSDAAISHTLHKKLGIGYEKLNKRSIGTAKKGAEMVSLGVSKPMCLKLEGLQQQFEIRPRVIKGLHTDLNISSYFLAKRKAKLSFSQERTMLAIDGEKTELVQNLHKKKASSNKDEVIPKTVKEERARNKKKVNRVRQREKSADGFHQIRAIKDIKCKKDTLTMIPVAKEKGLIRVLPIEEGSETCQPIGAVYQDTTKIAMLNLGDQKVVIPKGTVIARGIRLSKKIPRKREEQIQDVRMESEIKSGSQEEEKMVEKLWLELKLDQNKFLKKKPEIKRRVKEILRKRWKVFCSETKLIGETDLIEFEVELEEKARPFRGKVRPLNPKMKENLKEQLDVWTRESVAEPVQSPWASPMVPVSKPNGKTRWCVDYRQLNKMTVADSYPLPNIQENLERLSGGKIFSTLDASQAYHTIRVAENSKKALAFITPFGLYTFNRMPFGARNAASCYSRFVQLCLDKLRSPYVMSYLDDIILHTDSLEKHVEELDKVLEMHETAGIKLVPSKTHLFEEEVDYLGFRVGKDGIKMKEDYVQKILDWPSPKSVKELRSWLGFCGYYRTFIKRYSYYTNEMNSMRSSKKFEWTQKMEKKFQKLKEKFKEMPIRSYPQFEEDSSPFELTTDWSKNNLSAILSQKQDGSERLIAVFGRKTTPGESNYPPWKGELSAVIYGMRKAEHILRYKPFIVNTDASALVHLRSLKSLTGILARWMQELQTYSFEVKHRRGVDNSNADGVSRSTHLPEEEEEPEWNDTAMVNEIQEDMKDLDREVLLNAQREDPDLCRVRTWLQEGKPTKEEMKDFSEVLRVYAQQEIEEEPDGMLVRSIRGNTAPGKQRKTILIPERFKDAVFYWSHQHPSAGHFGIQASTLRAQYKFYYPGMVEDIKRKSKTCAPCLAKARLRTKDCVYKPRKSGFPGERLNIDLVGPLPKTRNGNKYILSIEDSFSRFVQAIPIKTKEAVHVAEALVEHHICIFGCPLEILSDQGREFVNKTWAELCQKLEIKKKETPPYNPNSNPVERFHRTLNAIFRTFMDRDDPGWERYLPMACMAYNSKVHSSTGQTPFLAWMGREARLPIDLVIPTPNQRFETVEEHVQDVLMRFQKMYQSMKEQNETVFRRNAKLYSGNFHNYQVGDRVLYYTSRKVKNKPLKLTSGWLGPYKLTKQLSEVLWVLVPADSEGNEVTVHVTRIRPFYGPLNPNVVTFPDAADIDDLGDELAEELTQPVSWTNPVDQMVGVPVQRGVPEVIIRDLPRKKVETKEAAQQSEPQKKTKTQARRERRRRKRDRTSSSSSEDKEDKRHRPGVESEEERRKRDREDSTEAEEQNEKRQKPTEASESKMKRKYETSQDEAETQNRSMKQRFLDLVLPSDDYSIESAPDADSSEGIDELALQAQLGTADKADKVEKDNMYYPFVRSGQKVTMDPGESLRMELKLSNAVPGNKWGVLVTLPILEGKGIVMSPFTVAPGTEGRLSAIFKNKSEKVFTVQRGQRVAQIVVLSTEI